MTKQRRREHTAPNLFALACSACGRQLMPTASGYLCCPNGHGRLVADVQPDAPAEAGGMFDQDTEEPRP